MRSGDLNLLVLRTADLDAARAFYEVVGLRFVEERHGEGPVHLAGRTPSGVVVELYPATDPHLPGRGEVGDVRLGLVVDDLDRVIDDLTAGGAPVVSAPKPSLWGRRAVVTDPDGRRVELLEAGSP